MLAVAAAALTFAYIGRFWLGLFLGPPRAEAARRSRRCWSRRSSCWPRSRVARRLRRRAVRRAGRRTPATVTARGGGRRRPGLPPRRPRRERHGAGRLGARRGSCSSRGARRVAVARACRRGRRAARAAPRSTASALHGAQRGLRPRVHDIEVRDLRNSIAAVLVPAGVLVALGVRGHADRGRLHVGAGRRRGPADRRRCSGCCVVAALTVVARPRAGCGRCSALSVLGFALAGVYALVGAPDVALVAVARRDDASRSCSSAVFARLPAEPPRPRPRAAAARPPAPRRRGRAVAGARGRSPTIWAALSRTRRRAGDAAEQHRADAATRTAATSSP